MSDHGTSDAGASSSTHKSVSPGIPVEAAREQNPGNLELMHHYTASTYLTISDSVEFQHIWQKVVPKEALAHDFLMHGILALAALHLAHERRGEKGRYNSAALRHYNLAIPSFRAVLEQVTPENCHALFSLSTILIVMTLAFAQTHSQPEEQDPVADILQIFTLLQGTQAVIQSAMRSIALGPMGPLVRRGLVARNHAPSMSIWNDPTQPFEQALDRLDACAVRTVENVGSREMYSLAVEKLRASFGRVRCYPGDRAAAVAWLLFMESSYVSAVRNSEPMALVIFAHYGVILHTLRGNWFVQDLASRLIDVIHSHLEDDWRPLVHWPMQKVGLMGEGLTSFERA